MAAQTYRRVRGAGPGSGALESAALGRPGGDTSSTRVRLLAAALLAFCAGCAHQPPAGPSRPPVNLSGYSAAFKEGFAAGCDTGRGSARRDARRYGEDEQYARGWEDGRSICSRR